MSQLSPVPLASPSAAAFLARRHRLFIGGEWVEPQAGGVLEVYDPAIGRKVAEVAAADAQDVDRAVRAARSAFDDGPWSSMTPVDRGRLITRLADRIEAVADEMAEIEAIDAGKALGAARAVDIGMTIKMLHYMAGWASKIYGETVPINAPGEYHAYTLREPVGVAALIVPWNYPLLLLAYKLGPALAAGCTVIVKPAEQTSLSALRLADLAQEVGFPAGVINVVTGDGPSAGAALVDHPGVDKISFTGSTAVGKTILRGAAGNLKRVSLELGGKSPMFVFPDADLHKVIPGTSSAIFFNQGQTCTAGSRLYVHRKIYDQVVAGIADGVRDVAPGHGLDPATTLGPLISERQLQRVSGYIGDGIAAGAELVVGGGRLAGDGYFIQPTVFADTTDDMAIAREEIFGPVLCAMPFDDDDIDRLAAIGNASVYGLAASVWTRDISVAHKMAKRLKAGTVWINTHDHFDPAMAFGGMKQSGWGRENGFHGVSLFTEVKAVLAAL